MKQFLRQIPAVHSLKSDSRFFQFCQSWQLSEHELTGLLQNEIDRLRSEIAADEYTGDRSPSKNILTEEVFSRLEQKLTGYQPYVLRRVINGAGIILHTNLGRARLSQTAISQVIETAGNYSNLEFQIKEGRRGSRHDVIDQLLQRITGAEAAMVVNNNAAAVYFILRGLAQDKEVIVSRGQLVEIGGSFRISAIMEESGAKLVEVGTTNKTHLYDYERAITEETAMILKVHTSNFKTLGFTAHVTTEELAKLAKGHEQMIFYEDLGSGALYDFSQHGIGDEPIVAEVLKQGTDLVSFSGDKLLGGPQVGIIAGKKKLIDQLKKHQLARVLRVDKMTLAALEGTLKAYENETAHVEIPTLRDILATKEEIEARAKAFIATLLARTSSYKCMLIDEYSQIGGGTMPTEVIETKAVALTMANISEEQLATLLRKSKPAIISRIKADKVVLDFRTITEEEGEMLIAALIKIETRIEKDSL